MTLRPSSIRCAVAAAALVAIGSVGAAGAGAAGGGATLLIRHQIAHCHTWSANGGPFKASQQLSLKAGSTLTVIDNDVMPHHLVALSGAPVVVHGASMNHMGAKATVRFAAPGVYRFRTRAGEDYMAGVKTTGEDNVLVLTVKVR
jgi:plastocyanin